jgi:hypothetical protein
VCHTTPQGSHAAPGQLLLLNTTEAFNKLDKAAAIKQVMHDKGCQHTSLQQSSCFTLRSSSHVSQQQGSRRTSRMYFPLLTCCRHANPHPHVRTQVGAQIWADIVSGAAEAQPHLLCRFLLLAHGDLKHFVYTYW